MKEKSVDAIKTKRWRLTKPLHLHTISEAKEFIDHLGILTVFSDKVLPNLYDATYSAGKPIAKDGSEGWDWDRIDRAWQFALMLARDKIVFYGKLIRNKNLLISMKAFASFYRLWGGKDYLDEYYAGNLSHTAKEMMAVFTKHKILNTKQIRSYILLRGKEGTKVLHKTLVELQGKGLLTCVGSIRRRSWDTFLWGILEDWVPEEIKIEAASLSKEEAMTNIIKQFVYSVVVTDELTITRFFKWNAEQVSERVNYLVSNGSLNVVDFEGNECLTLEG
ncbi:MAG: hypothetical protein HY769_08445 [Candidatus Stahlbacteria bacterium]|nr:hypothetical protein [Candidatus Stahlbacteria bacterium]